jgi:hypothetical protein
MIIFIFNFHVFSSISSTPLQLAIFLLLNKTIYDIMLPYSLSMSRVINKLVFPFIGVVTFAELPPISLSA